ncbi:glycoside hydrolase family 3 protein [Novosphingobium sp. B 225]|uniref:glycoside hydrolase family 3 protein n=1 Tax=Novosphingobium sp. B 225 TaxID=1961849 RepID=UPI000B4B5DBE|nr:glycoside hydrolase family 3 protein [Novosphingobium sp. B 225]
MRVRRFIFAAGVVVAALPVAGFARQVPVSIPQEARANPANWPDARSPAALSSARDETRIDAILAGMTIEQKVGQMIQADIASITPEDLARYPLGSILAGGNSGPYGDERADAAKWARLVGEFRQASIRSGARIPIIFGVDAVHGHSNLPGATIFPHNIGLGAARDPDLIRRIGMATAMEVAGSGIEWTFAPTLAVPKDLRWGRSYEGYSSDPALVARYSQAMTEGLQGTLRQGKRLPGDRVAATAKHFLADGGTQGGKDQGDARISEAELIASHARGYPAAINAGALTVMASFSSWNGVKNHGNPTLLTDVLKGRMGFAGLVVGDWNGHGQVPGCTVTDCAATFNAGLDLAMASDSWKGLFESTVRDARDGTISQSRIDDAVRRVLRVKLKLGLLDATPVLRGNPGVIGAASHLALAREAVAKSLVLLKNNGSVLPIKAGAKVLVTGPGADNMAMQNGGWTITWQGTDTGSADFPNGQTIGRAIASAVEEAGGSASISTGGTWTDKPDVAVVVFGEQPYAEFQGDVPDLAFRALRGEEALVARLKQAGVPVVSVFLSGRPLFAGSLINQSDAFVAAWLPGTQGRGVADVLVAGRNGKSPRGFVGRLPFAWPNDARSPVTEPLFAAGYGLDYRKAAMLAPINEDPKVELAATASEERYLSLGKTVGPWRLGFDSVVTARPVDLGAQEDSQQFRWEQNGAIALDGPAVSLRRQLGGSFALVLDWRIDALPAGPIRLAMAGGDVDITALVRALPMGKAVQSRIPLSCFAASGGNFDQVGSPLRLTGGQGLALTLRNVLIESSSTAFDCPAKP